MNKFDKDQVIEKILSMTKVYTRFDLCHMTKNELKKISFALKDRW